MESVTVKTTLSQYDIVIGNGLLNDLHQYLEFQLSSKKCNKIALVITKKLKKILFKEVTELLSLLKSSLFVIEIEDGEQYKNIQTLNTIYTQLLSQGANRNTLLMAIGGGVTGDIAGFAAATFMRGISFIQVPTTLLAMVDSSIGGKVAINHPLGKNMIGNFYQPQRVFIDVNFLNTLPEDEFKNGLAEVIKHGLIQDVDYFEYLENNLTAIFNRDVDILTQMISKSCRIKSNVVSQDEKEQNIRAILNYGHTFAHALESETQYQYFKHGEAVLHGMILAGEISAYFLGFDIQDKKRQNQMIEKIGLKPLPKLNVENFISAMKKDKKNKTNKIRLILLKKLGLAQIVENTPLDVIQKTLKDYLI